MTEPDWLAERFEAHRPHLRAVAYRMLGSLTEADDAVQDAWLRLNRSDTSDVRNLGAWLTTVVARLCLDMLRTRTARREEPLGVRVPEPIVSGPDGVDPEQEALLADSVGLAMLVVLETLTPSERLAFVLHDTFGLPFDEIAPIVGRSEVATRQLASRARRRVRGSSPEPDVDLQRHREVVDAFLAAARNGDFQALLAVLDPDIVVRSDGGARAFGPPEVRGAGAVVEQAMRFQRLAAGARRALVNGTPGIVVFAGERPFAILGFALRGEKIVEIDILADAERLAEIDLSHVQAGPAAEPRS